MKSVRREGQEHYSAERRAGPPDRPPDHGADRLARDGWSGSSVARPVHRRQLLMRIGDG